MNLKTLLSVGLGSVALASMASGAPIVSLTTALLAGVMVRNNHESPLTCLTQTISSRGKILNCSYKNNCDFRVSATAGSGMKIIEINGKSKCLKDGESFIPLGRSDLSLTKDPNARDCIVLRKNHSSNATDVRNHCNKEVEVRLRDDCAPIPMYESVPIDQNGKGEVSINFECFGEEGIKVQFKSDRKIEFFNN